MSLRAVCRSSQKPRLAYKQAISFSQQHILSAAAVWAIPVEAEGDGELQTFLAYGHVLSDAWIVQSSLRLKFPFEGASDGEAELAGIVHWVQHAVAAKRFSCSRNHGHEPVPLT